MQKHKLTLKAQTIITLEAGEHEVIVDGGNTYVQLFQTDEEAGKTTEAGTTASPKIADDTAAPKKETRKPRAAAPAAAVAEAAPATEVAKPAPRARAKAAPVVEDPTAGKTEIMPEEWDTLQPTDMVLAKLQMDDPEQAAKLWEAEVVGWKLVKGATEEKLFVRFLEDGQEDCLRDGDRLFEYEMTA